MRASRIRIFAVCFTASISSLDRLQMWREIEACTT